MNNCCICSAVKNVGKFLPKIFQNMLTIGSLFDDYVVIFFYDKSNDNTLEVLNKFKIQHKNVLVIENPTPLPSAAPRTCKIAHARNSLLNEIREKYKKFDM